MFCLSVLSAYRRTVALSVFALVSANALVIQGQTNGQAPSNYHGPNLYGVCVYISGDTSYYSNIFSVSGFFKIKTQEAFRQYALAQTKGETLKASACRWSTSQEEVATQKEADKRLLGLSGRSAKGVETGWTYNPTSEASAITQATAAPRSGSTVATSNSKAATSTTTSAKLTPTSTNTSQTSAQPASSTGSILQSTTQTVQSSVASSKATAAGAINDTVATTMGTVTNSATGALKSVFTRKPKQAGSSAAASSPAVDGKKPQPLGVESTESPLAATAEAQHIEGLVADVSGSDVIINVGMQAGVRPGMKLNVMRVSRQVKDPSSGKLLRTIEDKVGELTITNSDSTSAAGKFSGNSVPKTGDSVRNISQ